MGGMNGQGNFYGPCGIRPCPPEPVHHYHYTTVYQPAPAPAPPPAAPVIEAKPAPAFDPSTVAKPSPTTPEKPRYQLDTRARGYEDWLERNKPGGGGGRDGPDDSGGDTPSFGGGGGDRVRFYQDKLARGEPDAAVSGRYSSAADSGGERRMAGSRMFKERLNRYRS